MKNMHHKKKENNPLTEKKENNLLASWHLFLGSFTSFDKNYIYSVIADMLHLAVVLFILVPVFLLVMRAAISPMISEVMPTLNYISMSSQDMDSLPPLTDTLKEQLESNVRAMKKFFLSSALAIATGAAVVLALSSVFRGFVYSRLNRAESSSFIKKFFIHNCIWCLSFSALIIMSFFVFKFPASAYFVVLFALLLFLLTPVFRSLYSEKDRFDEVYRAFFKRGVLRLYKLIITYALIFIVAIASLFLLSVLARFLPSGFIAITVLAYAFLFVSWSRGFIFISAQKLIKKRNIDGK